MSHIFFRRDLQRPTSQRDPQICRSPIQPSTIPHEVGYPLQALTVLCPPLERIRWAPQSRSMLRTNGNFRENLRLRKTFRTCFKCKDVKQKQFFFAQIFCHYTVLNILNHYTVLNILNYYTVLIILNYYTVLNILNHYTVLFHFSRKLAGVVFIPIYQKQRQKSSIRWRSAISRNIFFVVYVVSFQDFAILRFW